MAHVDVNFDDVKDEPIGEGVYLALIDQEPEMEKKEKGDMVKVRMVIQDEGDFKGQMLFDNHCLWSNFGKVRLKQMIISAGLTAGAGGIDLAELSGRIVKVVVKQETYTPKDKATGEVTGEPRVQARISEYVPPQPEADDL